MLFIPTGCNCNRISIRKTMFFTKVGQPMNSFHVPVWKCYIISFVICSALFLNHSLRLCLAQPISSMILRNFSFRFFCMRGTFPTHCYIITRLRCIVCFNVQLFNPVKVFLRINTTYFKYLKRLRPIFSQSRVKFRFYTLPTFMCMHIPAVK